MQIGIGIHKPNTDMTPLEGGFSKKIMSMDMLKNGNSIKEGVLSQRYQKYKKITPASNHHMSDLRKLERRSYKIRSPNEGGFAFKSSDNFY